VSAGQAAAWILKCAVAGALVGAGVAVAAIHVAITRPGEAQIRSGDEQFRARQVERLRKGDIAGVIESLEHRMDVHLRGWGDEPERQGNPQLLARVAAYRSAHARRSADPELDAAVRRVLGLRSGVSPPRR
jgi:hypothetical protein